VNLASAASSAKTVGVLAPTGKDASLTAAVLHSGGIETIVCSDISVVDRIVEQGLGSLLVAEEALFGRNLGVLAAALARQAPWSDLPVLLLARQGADSAMVADALAALGNVTVVERPVRPAALLSTVRASLKARERQYQVRDYLAEKVRTEEMLRDADRRKDEFIATLAHELRNPLAPIRNALHIMRLSGDAESMNRRLGEMLERQVGHLVRLVDDLLEVSRITRGKVELRTEPVELAAAIGSAVEASRPLIEASRHQLAISLPTEPLIVDGDPVRLSQVFANLLNNAAKYMSEGGQIWLQARRDADDALVSIRDTGIGVSAEMLPHIFDMFTQVDRSSRQAQGGLGIGLTLVRKLVELHGGRIDARSEGIDRGSEFIVRLPLNRTATRAGRSIPEQGLSSLPACRVLVVDDNLDAARSLGLLLELMGVEVNVVNDGPAALAALSTFRPTLVLLDIGMPGMDGYEVARRIRSRDDGRDLKLIALTGWGQADDRERSHLAGFDHHLLKPADMSVLKSLILSAHGST
jgi:signal transduction histidine kinase